MATGQSRYGEGDLLSVPAVRKDGTTISIEFTIVPLKDATGKLIGITAILRDVTKRFEEMRLLRRKLAESTGRDDPRDFARRLRRLSRPHTQRKRPMTEVKQT
jgi:hypothetical protein